MIDIASSIEENSIYDLKRSKRKVLAVDIDIRSHNKKAIENHPMYNWIEMIEGSSISSEIIENQNTSSGIIFDLIIV